MNTSHHSTTNDSTFPPSPLTIRPFAPGDLDASIQLLGLTSARDISHRLLERLTSATSDELHVVLIAERDDRIVGVAKAITEPTIEGSASVSIVVAPEFEGTGVGTALSEALEQSIADSPLTLTAELRDDLARGREFAERSGFTVVHHSLGWRLDLTGRADDLATQVDQAAAELGLTVRAGDLVTDRAELLDCIVRSARGLPGPTGVIEDFDPEPVLGYFSPDSEVIFAEHDGRAIGMGVMHQVPDTDEWYTDFTGVDVDYRGRGVARLLKLAELERAARLGAAAMETHTDESNLGIVAVNRSAGMQPAVGYWSLLRSPA